MKKRIIALLLCCVMLLTLSPSLIATATAEDETTPAQTEVTVSPAKADLPRNKKVTLTAQAKDAKSYQWQIMAEDDLWVDISGETERTIQVSYAMVASLLNGNKAQLRCKTDLGTTDPAAVTVTEAQAVAAAPAKAAPKAGTVTKEAEAINSAVVHDGEGDVVNDETVTPGETIGDERDTYTIVINYVFADGKQAANPWTATVAKGSSYAQDVTSPTVLGYAPDQESVNVNVENAQKDTTYTVTYSAAQVDFTVKHYQQNLNDDQYTLKETETKKKYTDSLVGDNLAKSYEGFTALLYDTTTKIAADGSTVVEIYYDRNYFLMAFDLDGGYGVEPIYARYGSKIDVGTPTKAGYTFGGWQKVTEGQEPADVTSLPATMPAENSRYKAKWTAKELAKVTIVVWGENADDEGYSYIKNGAVMATPDEKLTLDDLQGKRICGLEEHTHTRDCGVNCKHVHDLTCYGLSENAQPVTPSAEALKYFAKLSGGIQDGYIYYFDDNGYNGTGDQYYLRLNGQYYHYDNEPTHNKGDRVGSRVSCSEGIGHATDYFYKYNLKVTCTHSHADSCYNCGKVAHTHTPDCYYNSNSFMDSKLWKRVRSDEITVAADGTSVMNVYYDRYEFTLHFRKKNSNSDNYDTIQAKWGANIREAFNTKSTQAGTSSWSRNSNARQPWTSYLDTMPTEDRTYYAYKTSGTSTAYYYVEGLDGKDELFYTSVASGTSLGVSKEEFIEIKGFTFNADRSTKENENFNGAKFYYTRNSYTLEFYNYTAVVDGKGGSVKYQASLKDYADFVPTYPSDLEPNAYVFDGWYTTAGCYAGSEADLNTMTMPAANLMLYAKWVPKTHTVKTWLTDKLDGAVNVGDTNVQTVAHGQQATEPAKPVNGNYTFVGWFYMDNGVEKAFDFSMPVNKDLDLYAKWNANTLVNYTIKYAVENKDGTLTYIADETTGSALAATTKTFEAKTGTQLNEGYQKGYFPETGSHSITMDINGNNEFTFIYVPKARVNYTVRYLEKGTNAILHEAKTAETSDAVITEKFVAITGYAPDAYQKRLVLGIDETQNVITFWYVKDDEHAPVQVIHWTQNIVGDGYTEYQSSTNLNAKLNEKQTSEALTISGFTYVKGTAVAGTKRTDFTAPDTPNATLTADGLVLNLYYDRIEYPYEFRFLEQGTNKKLAEPVTGTARYQAQVTQTAKDIPGYTLVSAENQAINIAIEDPADVASKNVRTFYYTEQTVDIKYEVVGPTGCGTLDNYQESQLKVITGEPKGSTPTANPGFKFVGWYLDENCVMDVDGTIPNAVDPTTNKLTPQKRQDGLHYAWTYYAKFDYDITDLTITKTYAAGAPKDPNQSAVFVVTGGDLGEGLTVVLNQGNNFKVVIKGLTVGTTYTVTEKTWTWRYTTAPTSPTSHSKELVTGEGNNTITFTNTLNNNKWLTGGAWCDNVWGKSPNKSTSTDYSGK